MVDGLSHWVGVIACENAIAFGSTNVVQGEMSERSGWLNGNALTLGEDWISWRFNGEVVEVHTEKMHQALLFADHELVIALVGKGDFATKVVGFHLDGSKKFEENAPSGFLLYYLTSYSAEGIEVVCIDSEGAAGSYDWNFNIDPATGDLTRLCRAY